MYTAGSDTEKQLNNSVVSRGRVLSEDTRVRNLWWQQNKRSGSEEFYTFHGVLA